jgi:sugar diacid utilization regulator
VDRELHRLEAITDETVFRIREELSDFALVPIDEHRETVREQLRRRLVAFRDRRAWDPTDLDQAVALAQRRARQGVSVDALISAYHVGDRQLWRSLSAMPGDAQALLPELASLMLESMQAVSTTLASAHSKESRARDRMELAVSQRLIDLLNTGTADAEASRLAEFLGLDLNVPCVALACAADRGEATRLDTPHIDRAVVIRGGISTTEIILIQAGDVNITEVIQTLVATCRVGRGEAHAGAAGAARSLAQARIALSSASTHRRVSDFADNWVFSCVTSHAALLEPEVLDIAAIATANLPLHQTIRAFADANMSVTQCARDAHLHPNTVVYRLERWRSLTGWDPRTFSGLLKSVAACELADPL